MIRRYVWRPVAGSLSSPSGNRHRGMSALGFINLAKCCRGAGGSLIVYRGPSALVRLQNGSPECCGCRAGRTCHLSRSNGQGSLKHPRRISDVSEPVNFCRSDGRLDRALYRPLTPRTFTLSSHDKAFAQVKAGSRGLEHQRDKGRGMFGQLAVIMWPAQCGGVCHRAWQGAKRINPSAFYDSRHLVCQPKSVRTWAAPCADADQQRCIRWLLHHYHALFAPVLS